MRACHLLLSAALFLLPASAAAQSCPNEYAGCDNGGCCLSSEHCCPRLEDGCCGASTPFCCGDGTCAATPSQCGSGAGPQCDAYDVPCGPGCAPAGSDCCDLAGRYCPPESVCTSETTCVLGTTPSLALNVPLTSAPDEQPELGLSPPYADPPDATERSCGVAPGARPSAVAGWLAVCALAWRARRATRPSVRRRAVRRQSPGGRSRP